MAANLPKPVEIFIAATHARDSKALMATFSSDRREGSYRASRRLGGLEIIP